MNKKSLDLSKICSRKVHNFENKAKFAVEVYDPNRSPRSISAPPIKDTSQIFENVKPDYFLQI